MKVTVCVPTVNPARERWFREALQSVADQTYRDFDIVIADNSQDRAYQSAIDRIVHDFRPIEILVVRHARRLLVQENFNSMIDSARGELVLFLTDDDALCPTFLAQATTAMESHPECGFTFSDHWVMNQDGETDLVATEDSSRRYGRTKLREGVYPQRALFRLAINQAFCLQTMLFRREVISSYRFLSEMVCGDLWLQLQLATDPRGLNAYYLSDRLFRYRFHGEQLTATSPRRDFLVSMIDAYERARVPAEFESEVQGILADLHLSCALVEAETRSGDAAGRSLRGLRLSPSLPRALRAAVVVAAPWAIGPLRRVRSELVGRRRSRRAPLATKGSAT